MLEEIKDYLSDMNLKEVGMMIIDIIIVYYLIYRTLLLIKGTRAIQTLIGILLVILLFFASQEEFLNLPTLNWLLDKFVSSFILIIIILFQNDIRRALAVVGRNPIFFSGQGQTRARLYEDIIKAVAKLSSKRLGALIVIEREADLRHFAEEGIQIQAEVTKELLFSIFNPTYENPLHDGAVIIRKGKVSHAGCFLPLSENPKLDKALGTRHRAGIGITEMTDAVSIIVSEETGAVSIAVNGTIIRNLDSKTMRDELQKIMGPKY
jgi:uncharacterized protein (TIGR00159 family)